MQRDPSRMAKRGGGSAARSRPGPSTSVQKPSRPSAPDLSWPAVDDLTDDEDVETSVDPAPKQRPAPEAKMTEAERPVTPNRDRTFRMPPASTQDTQATEERRERELIQAQVESENNKRDRDDPDFGESGSSRKKARVSDSTLFKRMELVRAIGKNWIEQPSEWIPAVISPKRRVGRTPKEPVELDVPTLKGLVELSKETKYDLAKAQQALSTAVTNRTEGGRTPTTLVKDDVAHAVRLLKEGCERNSEPGNTPSVMEARSPTFAPISAAEAATPLLQLDDVTEEDVPPPDATHGVVAPSTPPPRSPSAGPSRSRRAEKQPVRNERRADSVSVGGDLADPTFDDMTVVDARIDMINNLKAKEDKLRARRWLLEEEHNRWLSSHSQVSGVDDGHVSRQD